MKRKNPHRFRYQDIPITLPIAQALYAMVIDPRRRLSARTEAEKAAAVLLDYREENGKHIPVPKQFPCAGTLRKQIDDLSIRGVQNGMHGRVTETFFKHVFEPYFRRHISGLARLAAEQYPELVPILQTLSKPPPDMTRWDVEQLNSRAHALIPRAGDPRHALAYHVWFAAQTLAQYGNRWEMNGRSGSTTSASVLNLYGVALGRVQLLGLNGDKRSVAKAFIRHFSEKIPPYVFWQDWLDTQ